MTPATPDRPDEPRRDEAPGPVRRLVVLTRPFRRLQVAAWVLAGFSVLELVLVPLFVGNAIGAIDARDEGRFALYGGLIGLLGVVGACAWIMRGRLSARVSAGVVADLRGRLMRQYLRLDQRFHDRNQSGTLVSRASADLEPVQTLVGSSFVAILISATAMVVAGGVMFVLEWRLALFTLAPIPLIVWAFWRYQRRARPAEREVRRRVGAVAAEVEEAVAGQQVTRAFGREADRLGRFRAATERLFDQEMRATRLEALYSPIIDLLVGLGLVVVLNTGGHLAIKGDSGLLGLDENIGIGVFVTFIAYVTMLVGMARVLGRQLANAQAGIAAATRAFDILDAEPEVDSPPGGRPLPSSAVDVGSDRATLAYGDGPPAVADVDVHVPAGRRLGIVGTTGAGKTTLLAALNRHYDVRSGAVQIDAGDVRELDLRGVRERVNEADDDNFLFSTTVAENIAYGRPDASPEDVRAAARLAQADAFIAELPEGYETRIGERGATLSGGQRQRVAIARAVLGGGGVLLLDNATGSLDARTEAAVLEALDRDTGARTTLVVAYRAAALAACDEVIVLDAGRVIARGSHPDLVASSAAYRRLLGQLQDDDAQDAPDAAAAAPAAPERAREAGEAAEAGEVDDAESSSAAASTPVIDRPPPSRLALLADLVRPYPARAAIALVATLVAAGVALVPPLLTKEVVDDVAETTTPFQTDTLTILLLAVLVVAALATAAQIVQVEWIGQRVLSELRIRMFAHLQRLPTSFFDRERPGNIISRLTGNVEALEAIVTTGLVTLIADGLLLVGSVVAMAIISFELALVAMLVLPAIAAIIVVFRRVSGPRFRDAAEAKERLTGELQEVLAGGRVVRGYAQEARHLRRLDELNEINRVATIGALERASMVAPLTQLVLSVALAGLIFYGGEEVLAGAATVGTVVAFITYLQTAAEHLPGLTQLYSTFMEGSASLDRVYALLEERPPGIEPARETRPALAPVEGDVRFEAVTFGYDPERPIVREIDLHVRAGEHLAIVGGTGSGKSTLVKLVLRFYAPQRGRVLIDGTDLAAVAPHSWHAQLGVVPQEPFLFAGTIADNIAFARPGASREQVRAAADAIGALEILDLLPQGLDTDVGQRGRDLSSGQRQLVALARAVLGEPRVLILDEASSSIDAATEARVQRAFDHVLEGRTSLIVAHRLSTIRRADRIVYLDRGRVAELGTHDELVALGGHYAGLHEQWVASQGG